MSRRMANEFKPQMDGNAGPQPKKRRKANANAANANAGNNTANTPPTANTNQNNTPPIGMPPQDLAPPPPISTFGDTIVASNPFDDTPPNGKLHFLFPLLFIFIFDSIDVNLHLQNVLQCIKMVWWTMCRLIRIMWCEMSRIRTCNHRTIQMLIRCLRLNSETWWIREWSPAIKWTTSSPLMFKWCIQVSVLLLKSPISIRLNAEANENISLKETVRIRQCHTCTVAPYHRMETCKWMDRRHYEAYIKCK